MARTKRGAMVASILVLVAVIVSSCTRSVSSQPSVTNTSENLFSPTMALTMSMQEVQNIATATALALQSGTPNAAAVTATPGAGASVTPTPLIALPTDAVTTPTATLAVAATSQNQTSSTSVPVGSRPAEWVLKDGEFPYCIARRFDVDPDQLLTLNNLVDGQMLYPGAVLKIPQSGSFPGDRSLRSHPSSYTAVGGETVYAVACAFGDVRPEQIASDNGISVDATLTAGQTLTIK